ncbi:hypothetical protein A9Q74_06240 [Colwellia sp. 39_35_sub15_T18]|nr:hypothetical protein A9Q74_06240 [Colwellia sp. 39_35_sub15_T18]
MAIDKVMSEHQRLSILLALGAMNGYQTNDSMLQSACAAYGHTMSNDRVLSHLAWLKEQGLVSLESNGAYTMATLSGRGQDVSNGMATCPGVKKPRAK